MKVKDTLKPHDHPRVMDLVSEAGVDVTHWAQGKRGIVRTPASNPAYCYEWAFVQPERLVVLKLWHDQIEERDGQLSCDLSLREWSETVRQASVLQPSQRSAGSRRAISMDEAIKHAYKSQLTVRVILGDGPRQDLSDPKSLKASQMRYRLLDPEPWSVQRYDQSTGRCSLSRGTPPRFTDQFSTQDHLPKQHEVSGKAWERDFRVRVAVLRRARGICEFCGNTGFITAGGEVYLETHHVIPLSEGGCDHERNVVAVCPNDHREAHHGERRDAIRDRLLAMLTERYGE
jgi:5-methylcytosine-specific restriction enzyme A